MRTRHYRCGPGGRRYLLVNATEAAQELRRSYGARVSPEAIRQWASRGKIGSHSLGRDRYDMREIEEYATQIGLIKAADPGRV